MRRAALPSRLGAGALALVLCGCGQGGPDAATARNEILARTLMDAVARADTTTIVQLFWPDAVYDDYAGQLQYRGVQEIVSYLTSVHLWADALYLDVGAVHASPAGAVVEWLIAGVQARPMGDLVPVVTNREVVWNGVTILEVEMDRVRRAADYMDTAPILLQVGGRIELPGGVVRELDEPR